MKKSVLLFTLSAATFTAMAADDACSPCSINFEQIPYVEGTLYVSVTEGENKVLLEAVEVENDTVSFPVCLCEYNGKTLSVNAFQDLNGNKQLDFDNYGRPTEPCLRDQLTPSTDAKTYPFDLIEY